MDVLNSTHVVMLLWFFGLSPGKVLNFIKFQGLVVSASGICSRSDERFLTSNFRIVMCYKGEYFALAVSDDASVIKKHWKYLTEDLATGMQLQP